MSGCGPPSAIRVAATSSRRRRCSTASRSRRQNPGGPKGYDPGKKVKGRKRHLLVDTMGLILSVAVLPADVPDRDGAKIMLESLKAPFGWVQKVWADGAYAGQLVEWVAGLRSYRPVELEIVKRSEEAVGFEVIAKRWIVERTLGWLNRCRRLSKDYEATIRSAVAMIRLAMIHVMVRRLAPMTAFQTSSNTERAGFGRVRLTSIRGHARQAPGPLRRPWSHAFIPPRSFHGTCSRMRRFRGPRRPSRTVSRPSGDIFFHPRSMQRTRGPFA
jgi:transposase